MVHSDGTSRPPMPPVRPIMVSGHVLLDLERESYDAQRWIGPRLTAAPMCSTATIFVGTLHVDLVDSRVPNLIVEAARARSLDLDFTGDPYAVSTWVCALRGLLYPRPSGAPPLPTRRLTLVPDGAA